MEAIPLAIPLSAPSLLGRTFRSLRHRNYRLYFLGQVVSFTGSWMQSVALMWLAFEFTHDPLWPGYMFVAAVGPTVLLGPVGGALADRFPKKWLIFVTQSLFLASAVVFTLVVALGVPHPLPLLLMLQCVNGIVQAIDLPARLSFVPELIPKEDLINAVGLNSLTFNLGRSLGPALAGLVFLLATGAGRAGMMPGANPTRIGAISCFALNALSYAAVLAALVRIHAEPLAGKSTGGSGRFWDGVRFIAVRPGLLGLMILTGVMSIFVWPALTLLPAYTTDVLQRNKEEYSFLVSAFGGGALAGSLIAAAFSTIGRRERLILLGTFCSLLGIAGIMLATAMPLAFASYGMLGFGLILYLSTGQSTLQLGSLDSARGKVMALWAMTLSASSIPGHLVAGTAARHYPLEDVLAVMLIGTAITALGVVALVLSGKLRS